MFLSKPKVKCGRTHFKDIVVNSESRYNMYIGKHVMYLVFTLMLQLFLLHPILKFTFSVTKVWRWIYLKLISIISIITFKKSLSPLTIFNIHLSKWIQNYSSLLSCKNINFRIINFDSIKRALWVLLLHFKWQFLHWYQIKF